MFYHLAAPKTNEMDDQLAGFLAVSLSLLFIEAKYAIKVEESVYII